MEFRLFLRNDLFKADEPPTPKAPTPGAGQEVDYVESQEPPPGNLGQTEGGKWRVPKGSISPKTGKVEDPKAEKKAAKEELDKDPLKVGKEPPEKSTPTLAEPGKPFPGNEPVTLRDPHATFNSMDPKDHENTDPMGHYMHAKVAEELGDKKLAHFHREQARAKVGADEADPARRGIYHQDMADKLRSAGMHEDAKHHSSKVSEAVAQRMSETTPTQPDMTTPTQAGGAKAAKQRQIAREDEKLKARHAKKQAGEGQVKTEVSEDTLRQQQMAGQKRAIEEFHEMGRAHEKATVEYKAAGEQYEKKLQEHKEAHQEHATQLKDLSQKLKDVKAGKPVKDDKNLKQMKKDMKKLRMEAARHKDNPPKKPIRKPGQSEGSWEASASSHAKAAEKHKSEQKKYKEQLRKMTEAHDKEQEKVNSKHEKNLKAHAKKVEQAKAVVDKHKAKKEKLPEKPQKSSVKEPKAPPDKPKSTKEKLSHGEHQKGASAIRETIESHLRDNKDLSSEDRRKLSQLHSMASFHEHLQHTPTSEQKKELRDLVSRAKEHEAHRPHQEVAAEKQEKESKQQEKEQREFERKRVQADKRVQSERENTLRAPENEFDQGEVHQHTSAAKEAHENIQSHLENNPDLDDDTKAHLETMSSKLEEHTKLGTVPTKEQKNELKQVQKLTKKHSGKHFHDTPEGKATVESGQAPVSKEPEASKKTKDTTGSNLLSLYNRGAAFGSKVGAAAASPYGGAGTFAEAVDYAGRGAATAGHHLLKQDKRKAPEDTQDLRASSAEEKTMDIASRRAKPQEQTTKSLRLWVRR